MSNRQRIGLRKKKPARTRAPGRQRRQQLLDAAYELLCTQDIEDVSFRDIAEHAGIAEGSAYHHFANRFDLFTDLACHLNDEFIAEHNKPVPAAKRKTWSALAEYLVDVGARVYAKNPPARQLFIGGKAPLQVKQGERMNDRDVGDAMYRSYSRYFKIPDDDEIRNAFYYFIEITDLMFALSLLEHGKITRRMREEAKRAGVSYLGYYLSGHAIPRVSAGG